MYSMFTLSVFAGFSITGLCADRPVAPAPREKPMLKCELRWTGKFEMTLGGQRRVLDSPDDAELTITNISGRDVNIGSNLGPAASLDLKVKDPSGNEVKTKPLSSILSPETLFKPKPYILKPGEKYQTAVALLCMVPEEKRVAGTYRVKAVYDFKGKVYVSNEIEVKWPGKKK